MEKLEVFLKDRFTALAAQLEQATPLGSLRQEAIESVQALGIPDNRDEQWKYTDIRKALSNDLEPLLTLPTNGSALQSAESWKIKNLPANALVFVNGCYDESLSSISSLPDGVIVCNLRMASIEHRELLLRYFGQIADSKKDPFSALNTAFTVDGAFVYVPKGVEMETPVEVVSVTHGVQAGSIHLRNVYAFEDESKGTIVETFGSAADIGFVTNSIAEFIVGARANVSQYRVQYENDKSTHVCGTYAEQAESSHFTSVTLTLAGKIVRNNVRIRPAAEFCETHLGGLYLLQGDEHVDNNTFVDHVKPHCYSNEIYKGILDDRATSAFSGMLMVRPDSQQTNAFQENKTILLSEEASSYSKPQLEIYADDVKCSHGATTGAVDPEALFYLRVRGIDEERARNMLLHAFVNDVLELISHEPLKDYVLSVLEERLAQSV